MFGIKHYVLKIMKKRVLSLIVLLTFVLGLIFSMSGCFLFKCNEPDEPKDSDSSVEPDEPNKPNEPEENKEMSVIEIGDLRVQLLSDTIVRIENKGPKGFEDRPSYIVLNRNDYDHVEYTLEEKDGITVIKTAKYIVNIPNGAAAEDTYITNPSGDRIWTYSDAGRTDTNVYLPSPSDELKSWYFTDSPRIIPSEYGYSSTQKVNALQDWDFDNDALDVFVFLPGGDYSQFCSDYIRVTGESEMVSLQTLGYWDSRWYAYSAETAIQQINNYMNNGYAIDVLVIDTDWRASQSDGQGSGGIGYDINKDLFPDMAAFLQECEEMGVDICFNDHPEPVKGTSNGLDKAEVDYRSEKLTLVLSLGLDYWWYDRNWSVSLNSCDPDISTYAFGMYAYQWITEEYRDSVVDWDEFAKRSLIMANVDGVLHGKWYYASDLSAHRYSIQWTGDIAANSDALAREIYTSVFGGAEVGLPYMSSDIGGHNQPVTDEMYARWIQYGALSTICRVHCTNEKYIHQEGRMPWLFGETAEEIAHTYLDMRYRLLPLYYSLARENYDSGLPIMQRVDIQYPEYVEASRNDEYLLGDYILVAPINETDSKVPDELFSYVENGKVINGLKAEYYNNNNWSGSPVLTRTESNIYYNFTTKGPGGIDLTDNFSIRWTGNITIGERDAALSFFADDAIVVYIDGVKVVDGLNVYDTYLSTPVYKAGSTHSIEVRYAEYGYNAHVYMTYVQQGDSACYNTRTVFIPDGTWIDVWSGERFVGPATYMVTHPLETSPIFVREGALIALAPNMLNTNYDNWDEMVLDVYPSANYEANITLYEDDTKTDAYKQGHFRTTDISMDFDVNKQALIVKIGAANGEFEGDRAFAERKWTFRLHTNPGWGAVASIVVNGEVVDFEFISKSSSGVPFAFEGASLDGDVYEFAVEGSVYAEYEIKVFYESTKESEMKYSYEKIEIPFELSVDASGDGVKLDDTAIDWIAFGEGNSNLYTTKNGLNVFSSTNSYDTPWVEGGGFAKMFEGGAFSSAYLNSQKDFSFEINTEKDANYYVLYLGGYQSTAKVTVRDSAGNVQTVNFGNIDGGYAKRVIIETKDNTEGKLYVTYSMVASEYTKNIYNNNSYDLVCYLSMYAAVAYSELPEKLEFSDASVSVKLESSIDATGSANLTEIGDLDWMHFGSDVDLVQKQNGDILGNVVFGASFKFYDYNMSISYSDGAEQASNLGSTNGLCDTDAITITLNVNPSVKKVILYTGAWETTNEIEVYSANGQLLASAAPFAAGTTSVNKIVTFEVDASESSIITIIISNAGQAGNVSLAAIAVSSNEGNVGGGETVEGTLTIKHLNLDGSLIKSETIENFSIPYTVNAKEYAGLTPSHDYVIIKDSTVDTINIYYSEIDVWNGSDVSGSLKGSGTAADPYLIQSGADLAYIDKNMTATENFKGSYFKMTKSIDLNGNSMKLGAYPGWSGRLTFAGVFDGNNCSIRNLNMTESGMGAGLFSVVTGTVKNLTVYGTVKGNDKMTGGIVGWLYQGNLENCSSYVNVTSTGSAETGGITGTSQGNITKCINYGSVTGKDSVGGIAGMASGTLTSCRNYGSLSGTSNVNDIFGSVHSSGSPVVTDCGAIYEFFLDESIIQDPTNYDYSFAIIGDQQCMVQYARELNSDKNFKLIYDYILNNASSKNITHVFNLGDIVQTTYEYEPTSSDEHKAKMDKEAEFAYKQIARLDGVVDYSLIRGNHDGPVFYEEYYGVNSTYTDYASQVGDNYFINSTNSVHFFTAGDLDYMVVTLDFGAGDLVVAWANEVIAAHPNHNVIIATHAYMHRTGELLANDNLCARKPDGTNDPLYNTQMGTVANNGDDLWNKLVKKHANIVMVLSGHVDSDNVVCTQLTGDNGNTVTNILINPQAMDSRYKSSGGVGAVAMFYFSNGGKTVEVRYYSTVQGAYIKSENQYTFTINTIPKQ